MLEIPFETQQIQQEKKKNRVNVRFSDEQIESLDKICDEKGIKSRSKVLKSALELVTKGTSNIDFGIITDYSKEPRKTILFEDGKKIRGNCPHCKGKTRLDPEHYKKFQKEIQVLPSHIPGFYCRDVNCFEIHPNPAYQELPKAICNNCFQLAKKIRPQCVWCERFGTLKPVSESQLETMNIVKPQE